MASGFETSSQKSEAFGITTSTVARACGSAIVQLPSFAFVDGPATAAELTAIAPIVRIAMAASLALICLSFCSITVTRVALRPEKKLRPG